MKSWLLLALLALAVTATIPEEDDVLVLTDDNFDEAIKNEFILVEFYAPWCGHCKKLTPEFAAAAKTLKSSEKPVPLAKVDATVHKKCSGKFDIKGFPTIKFFNNGQAIEYNGGRTASEIVNWINKRTGDVSIHLSNQAAIEKFTSENNLAIVFFTESASGAQWDAFKSIAMSYDKINFAHVTDAALAAENKSALGKLVLFKHFDEKRNDYEGEFTVEAIKAFVDQKKLATVMDFDDTAIEVVFQQGKPTLVLFANESDESATARTNFETAAQELKEGSVKFCALNPKNQHWNRLADYIGVNVSKAPQAMLVKTTQDVEKYQFDRAITVENIKAFVQEFQDNKLTQHVKTEDIPAENSQPVKVIVGKQFEELVLNSDKDVLVKFYAPWCGHCKTLIPVWEEAALKLEANPNVVIAKCDSTANEIPNVEIKGFPTIKFFKAGAKKAPIDFSGERTTEGILKFLKENTSHPWVDLEAAPEAEKPKKDDL